MAVTGEFKGKALGFETKDAQEAVTAVLDGAEMHGTYSYCVGDKCYKTGVKMKRPAR